jgi:regulator of protease activity HflC (stomatin/prohibitin superfamily)
MLLAIPLLLMLGGCGSRIGPGMVGIKVDYAGSDRGAEAYPIRTGWVFYAPWSSTVVEYPTYVQTAKWTRSPHEGDNPESGDKVNEEISFNSAEGMGVTADISLSYHLLPEKVPSFYVKFRSDDIVHFTHGFLRNVARDAFNDVGGHYKVEDIMGSKKEEFIATVKSKTQANVQDIGVVIDQMGFIESPRPPQSVIDSINAKVQAQQIALQKGNEVMQAEADAKKQIAQATGQAESNRIVTQSITPTLIEWQKLIVTDRWIARWNGQMPSVETGQTPGMLLNIPTK